MSLRLLREQHVTRVLDRASNRALMLRAKTRVFAGQNLARIGHVSAHCLRLSERNLRGRGCLLLLFSGAHCSKRGENVNQPYDLSTGILPRRSRLSDGEKAIDGQTGRDRFGGTCGRHGARDRIRTGTSVRKSDFKSEASTVPPPGLPTCCFLSVPRRWNREQCPDSFTSANDIKSTPKSECSYETSVGLWRPGGIEPCRAF
jgi:hypothetical protein